MKVSRRSLLATATTTALAASVPAIADTNQIDTLWLERRRILDALGVNGAAYREATSRLPAWAVPGPRQMDGEGNRVGEETGWPEVESPQLASSLSARRLIRIGPADVRHNFHEWVRIFGPATEATRAKARAQYRETMRKVIARVRKQERLEVELGIPALAEQGKALCDTLFDVEDRIREVAASGDLNAVAAAAIIAVSYDQNTHDCVPQSTAVMLKAMRPSLRGKVAADVVELLADPDKPISAFRFMMQEGVGA